MKLAPEKIEQIEVDCLLDVIYQRLGYDFRDYSPDSLRRRLNFLVEQERVDSIAELIPRVIHDELFASRLINSLLVNVTDMFRDPAFYKSFVDNVFPILKTFSFFKVWSAGCSTGEEAFSLAILLHEHGLLERARIYATDLSPQVIRKAKEGLFSADKIEQYTQGYRQAGGQRELSDYFFSCYDCAKLEERIKKHITFACHNLVSDSVFTEVEVIICRNVLIYFDRSLKRKVVSLFTSGLHPGGVLCLGSQESLNGLYDDESYEPISVTNRIYKRTHSIAQVASIYH
ncbi:CheR family methyltransferase [Litoribrevibacter euphylliae]|uniref:CheR family methyltransferase n=1 Tax=Litoribrevibacter euphylliae TaxID=1834034 RepID=A0ABV7HHH5_9GAMM